MNADTFKLLFLPYHEKLYRIAFRLMEDKQDAEDMVQEVYIKLWNKRKELRDIRNAESFAVVVLKNTCLDYLKKSKYETTDLYQLEIPACGSLMKQIEFIDELQKVEQIIESLPKNQKEIIRLRYTYGYTDKEVEKLTGLNRNNIKVILSRARKIIKELFFQLEKQ